jgi:hypothetical protein
VKGCTQKAGITVKECTRDSPRGCWPLASALLAPPPPSLLSFVLYFLYLSPLFNLHIRRHFPCLLGLHT